MDNQQKKEGVSVKEIEEFAKKNRFEVFFCLIFLFACIFGLFGFFKSGWNIVTVSAGAILGIFFPLKVDHYLKKTFAFILKHEITMQLVVGIGSLALTVCFPFATFFMIGLFGGKSIHKQVSEPSNKS